MLTIRQEDIFIGCRANSKKKALRIAADALQASGYVSNGFFESMLDREKVLSTWLGAGVAMPHCTKEGIDLVTQTGFQVFQFPEGVGWGEGKVAFLVVAVAAQNNEHIDVIAALADLLDDEVKTTLLASAKSKEEFLGILEGN
ncbi:MULTISPECIES: PTS sugar transporter subunit IIA [Raoultella]|uniref:PTS sugar transporter subunit IIA n=1 Tax=Raoultella TaxID=160674 RepID=UPI0021675115|nr:MULTISPECIES: PTS sugar transporter subunit IIA [Raoultella]MCS4269624.1 phosphocarrier protein FPr [Raoultella sp. BIGb0132]MCS4286584.1 phosphocarrier protein FPr [Raoultella terrigena]